MVRGLVLKIQRFSIQDGPGIRTTLFLKGCPLSCIWCSNPESQKPFPEIMFYKNRCIEGCEKCVNVCPVAAITVENGIKINREKCTKCGKCAEVCPKEALNLVGKYVMVSDILTEIERDAPFYKESVGGVTISGGEPLFQLQFTKDVLKTCKERGIDTALDTCGFAKWRTLNGILKYVDLVLYDVKHMDPMIHKNYTGVTNKIILENLRCINTEGIPIFVRVPVISGINDTNENIRLLAEFVRGLGSVKKVDLLPYHRTGIYKYEALGQKYQLEDLKPPSKERLYEIKNQVESYGLKAQIVV